MKKKIDQSRKAKREFDSQMLYLLNSKTDTTRGELVHKTGWCDRVVRDEVSKLSKHYAVFSHGSKTGYRLAKQVNNLTLEEAYEERRQKSLSLNERAKKVQDLKAGMKPLIAYGKVLDKRIEELEALKGESSCQQS